MVGVGDVIFCCYYYGTYVALKKLMVKYLALLRTAIFILSVTLYHQLFPVDSLTIMYDLLISSDYSNLFDGKL